jgi:hypothetical protein
MRLLGAVPLLSDAPPIVPRLLDRALFDRVQTTLSERWTHRTRTRTIFHHLLTGLIFDDAGHRMAPTHAQKNGGRYSYYISRPLLFGNAAAANVGSVSRAPAPDIDDQVRKAVLEPRHRQLKSTGPIDNAVASSIIDRIEVQKNRLIVQLKRDSDKPTDDDESTIVIPWTKPPSKRTRSILRPNSTRLPLRPMKLERRATLVAAIARGRRWLDELIADRTTDAHTFAKREHCSLRHVNMTLSLAFLAPALVKAAIEGRLPRGIGVEQLRELPLEWDRQFEALALDPI